MDDKRCRSCVKRKKKESSKGEQTRKRKQSGGENSSSSKKKQAKEGEVGETSLKSKKRTLLLKIGNHVFGKIYLDSAKVG